MTEIADGVFAAPAHSTETVARCVPAPRSAMSGWSVIVYGVELPLTAAESQSVAAPS